MGVVSVSNTVLTNNTKLTANVTETTKMFFTFTLNPAYYYRTTEQLYESTVNRFIAYFMHIGFIGTLSVELTSDFVPHYHAIGTCHIPNNFLNKGDYYFINIAKRFIGPLLGRSRKIESAFNEEKCEEYVIKDVQKTSEYLPNREVCWRFVRPTERMNITDYIERDKRRATLKERLEHLEEKILDMKTVIELDSSIDTELENQYDNLFCDYDL